MQMNRKFNRGENLWREKKKNVSVYSFSRFISLTNELYIILLGRGIGLLVSSFIYIVIDQRLLFLVFALFNLIAAFIYSIYFLFTRTKRTNPNLSLSHPLTDIGS